MTATVTETDLSLALLNSIKDGSYPESEDVLTADLPASALPSALKAVQDARIELESEIRSLSRETAPNVDDWIAQARQLHKDIARSKALAREVVRDYETGKTLVSATQDAVAKVDLLHEEVRFNANVSSALEDIISFRNELQTTQLALAKGDYLESSSRLETLRKCVENVGENNANKIIRDQITELHSATHKALEAAFKTKIRFGQSENQRWMKVEYDPEASPEGTLNPLVEAFSRLGTLHLVTKSLSHDINRSICMPVSSGFGDRALSAVIVGSQLDIIFSAGKKDVYNVLESVTTIIKYLDLVLPSTIKQPVLSSIMPDTISTLAARWLNPSVPIELSDLSQLQKIQERVKEVANFLLSCDWLGHRELLDWVEQVPKLWLTKRRMSSLDSIRKAFIAPRGPSRQVERIERQIVSKRDEAFPVQGGADDWDAGWQEDANANARTEPAARVEEEEYSGWDFEDQATGRDGASSSRKEPPEPEEDDSADAWGWNDEDPEESRTNPPTPATTKPIPMRANGTNFTDNDEREIVLKETYTITDIPDYVLEIVAKDVQDAEMVKNPQYALLHGISPSSGLIALPTLVLAMFRAIAPTCYASSLRSWNMNLYNDCSYVAEKLRDFSTSTPVLKVSNDCDSLEKFAKTAYAREMDIQRTVLGDLLDGAQGFSRCTQYPFSQECETAISSTTDRVRDVYKEWISILSHSALLQSMGSLTATIIDKVVKDIEDLEDISESESQRLTSFCNQISKLEDLFMPETSQTDAAGEGETTPLTAIYVSNWLRFQYLLNILESSLVDIKYLWTEGELSLEFSAEEVIDLIKALFAESHHRRNAIIEIRRSGK